MKSFIIGVTFAALFGQALSACEFTDWTQNPPGYTCTVPTGKFVFQNDGNLVISTNDNMVKWTSNSAGGNNFVFQSDGNCVIYEGNDPLWAAGTNPQGRKLVLQDDLNMVILDGSGNIIWQTHTGVTD